MVNCGGSWSVNGEVIGRGNGRVTWTLILRVMKEIVFNLIFFCLLLKLLRMPFLDFFEKQNLLVV